MKKMVAFAKKTTETPEMGNSLQSSSLFLKDSGHKPSSRSRNSVIQGSTCFVWDREKSRKTQPYYDHKYDLPFNPPPNEVNFLGGLGKKKGNPRSKIHPNRPTTVQKLLNMRTSNRILTTFGEPLLKANCSVHEKKLISPSDVVREVNNVVNKIKVADNYDTPSGSEVSSSLDINIDFQPRFPIRKSSVLDEPTQQDYTYFYNKQELKMLSRHIIEKEMRGMEFKYQPDTEEKSFREWATELRNKFKEKQKSGSSSAEQAQRVKIVNPEIDRKLSIICGSEDGQSSGDIRFRAKNIKKLGGYLYGPFSKVPTPDEFTKDESKFAIPRTMTDRYEIEYRKRQIRKRLLRRARLNHMGLPMPPSGEYSSDEEMEEIKTLALIRTPYFIIPTVKTQKKKKVDRFKNRYLRRAGLRRITMLFHDRTYSKKAKTKITDPFEDFLAREKRSMKKIIKKVRRALLFRPTPTKEKYTKFIKDQYLKQRKLYNDQLEAAKHRITFEEFKRLEALEENNDEKEKDTEIQEKESTEKFTRDKSMKKFYILSKPKCVFRRYKLPRMSREDELVGPFYTDPNLMEKFRSPWMFKKESKFYTSLIRSRFGLRNRLQVNSEEFDEEKLGVTEKFYSRLSTEWDNYYINELRHRPRVRKYCVKSDTIFFRETTRKKFIMSYIQENLLNLRAKQKIEENYLNEFEKFVDDCEKLFNKKKFEAYDKAMKKISEINPLIMETKELEKRKLLLKNQCESISENILKSKAKLFDCLRMQNYYFLLMDSDWRLKHDWIHRNENGKLKTPIEVLGRKTNDSQKPMLTGFEVKEYFKEKVEPIIDKVIPTAPDPELMKMGILKLKIKAFTYLTHHNTTLWLYETIYFHHEQLLKMYKQFFEEKQKLIEFQKRKLNFIEERNYLLSYDVMVITKKPLIKCVKNPDIRKISAICDQLYSTVVSDDQQDKEIRENLPVIEKFILIQEKLMDLLEELDRLPAYIMKSSEKITRQNRQKLMQGAKKAVVKQNRLNILKRQIKFHFNLTLKKPLTSHHGKDKGRDSRQSRTSSPTKNESAKGSTKQGTPSAKNQKNLKQDSTKKI